MLVGSSKTQMVRRERVGLVQKVQGSTSVMLLQTEQRCSFAFRFRIAAERDSASVCEVRRMWKASRCADLEPTPGSLRSSSIRRDMGGAKRSKRVPSCSFVV